MRQLLVGLFIIIGAVLLFSWKIPHPSFSLFSDLLTPSPTMQVMGTFDKNSQSSFTIAKVLDGDTIETKDGKKIRYIGINAPELGQPYGEEAMDFNKSLVLGKKVSVVYDKEQKDVYGRILGYVYVGSEFVNLEMIQKGWAVAENISPNTSHQQEFGSAEKNAQHACQGLWSDLCMPVSASCMKISTIHYDAAGNDNTNLNDEWVQVTNYCPDTVDLSGWLLKDSSAMHAYNFNAISLEPNTSLKIHSGCGSDSITDLYWQCNSGSTAIWNNTGDEAMLFDRHGKLLSVYKY